MRWIEGVTTFFQNILEYCKFWRQIKLHLSQDVWSPIQLMNLYTISTLVQTVIDMLIDTLNVYIPNVFIYWYIARQDFFFELRLAGYLEFLCLNFFVLLASRRAHLTTLFRSGCGLYHSFGYIHLPVLVSRLTLVYPITVWGCCLMLLWI